MEPTPLTNLVLRTARSATDCARKLSPSLGIQVDLQLVAAQSGGDNTVVLDPEGKTYDTGNEHGSFLRYSGFRLQLLNSGFDSCSPSFRAHPWHTF